MSSKRILYMHIGSPPARAVLMLIDLLGLEVENRTLHPVLREQDTPELVKKNPMRTIPILIDGDFSLPDSHAIMIYLMEKYSKPEHQHLYPLETTTRATVHKILFFDCGILFPRLRSVMAPTYGGKLAEMSKSQIRNINDAYGMLEIFLADKPYLACDNMTIADLSVLATITSLHGLNPIDDRYPKLKRWLEMMNKKDVCIRINKEGGEEHVAGLKAMMAITKEKMKSKL